MHLLEYVKKNIERFGVVYSDLSTGGQTMNQENDVKYFLCDQEAFRWKGLDVKTYPASGTQSQGMSKQVLFSGNEHLPTEVRYFEAEPGGYSALERHEHVHAVLIIRGQGSVLLDGTISTIGAFDTVYVPPHTWHQFYADRDDWLGFLCMVHCQRDRPQRPSAEDIRQISMDPQIQSRIRW